MHKNDSRYARSGRPLKFDKKTTKCLVKSFRNKDGCNQRVSAKKFNVSQRTVGKYLKETIVHPNDDDDDLKENGIEYFKKVKVPFVAEKQLPKIIIIIIRMYYDR